MGLTQGSQNLALGLTLAAAPQLVEGSRLISNGCERIGTSVPGRWATTTDSLGLRCVKYMNLDKPVGLIHSSGALIFAAKARTDPFNR